MVMRSQIAPFFLPCSRPLDGPLFLQGSLTERGRRSGADGCGVKAPVGPREDTATAMGERCRRRRRRRCGGSGAGPRRCGLLRRARAPSGTGSHSQDGAPGSHSNSIRIREKGKERG